MKNNDTIIKQLKDLVEELHKQTLKQDTLETTHIRVNTLMKKATDYTHLLNEAYTDLKETLKENRPLQEVFMHTESTPEATMRIMKKIDRLNTVIKDIKEYFGTVNYFV